MNLLKRGVNAAGRTVKGSTIFVLLVLCTAFAVPSLLVHYTHLVASNFFEDFRWQYENEGLVGAFKGIGDLFKTVFNYIRGK